MKINVITDSNTVVKINISSTSTVADIIAQLPKYDFHPPPASTLPDQLVPRPVLIRGGTELKSEQTLQELNLGNRATLHYAFRRPLQVMRIFITNTSTHKAILLECSSSDTIKTIKEMISNRWNIPVDLQQLYFTEQNLNDDKTLLYYNVQNDSFLRLNVRMMISIVNSASVSDIVTVEALPGDRICDIEMKIVKKLKVYGARLKFIKAKVQDPRDNFKDSTLNLWFDCFPGAYWRVFVDESSMDDDGNPKDIRLYTFKVEETQTIEEVNAMVKAKRGTGLNPKNFSDNYGGQWAFIDNRMSLTAILKKSPFDSNILKRGGMLIYIDPKAPKKLSLEVEPDYSVLKTKHLIQEKGFVSAADEYELSFGNTILSQDLSPLSFYKIIPNSELALTILN